MSFTENNMNVFSARCKAFMQSLQNLRDEATKLEAIYTNEALSGAELTFVEVDGITKEEHIDAILMFQDLKKFLENEPVATTDRQQWITPFTQDKS